MGQQSKLKAEVAGGQRRQSPPQGAGITLPCPTKKKKSIAAGKLPEPLALCHPICYTEHSGTRRGRIYIQRKDVLTNDYRNLHAVPKIPGLHRGLLYTRSLGGAEYPGSPRHHRLPGRRLPVPSSDREAEPVALQYFAAGLNVFILNYSIQDKAHDSAPAD